MHVGRDSLHPLHVDYVHIGMTLGFVMDVFIQTLLSHPQVPFGRKLGLLRALSKVMWIQNDLFARWYVRDDSDLNNDSSERDTDSSGHHSGRGGHHGGGGSGSTSGSGGATNGHLSPNDANGCPYSGAGKDRSDTGTRPRQSSRNYSKTASVYSNNSGHSNSAPSNKAFSEATTVARRDDESSSYSSAGTATTTGNQVYRDPDTNNSSTSLESKRSLGQLSTSSSTDQLQQQHHQPEQHPRLNGSSLRSSRREPGRKEDESLNIPLVINNEFSSTQKQFDVRNPASGKLVGRCSSASADDCNAAVQAAHAAFRVWSKLPPYSRRDLMIRAADIMLNRKEELIQYQREETGAGRLFAEHTFMLAVSFLKDFASRIPSIEGSVPTVAEEGRYAMVIKEPYGVILGVVPW